MEEKQLPEKDQFDVLGFITAFEAGELTTDEVISGFQRLIDSGIVWKLQGVYGRTANELIRERFCHPAKGTVV